MTPRRLLIAVCLVACEPASEGATATRADSAGVEVVVSAEPARDSVLPALGETLLSLTEHGHEFYSVVDFVQVDSLLIVAEPTRVRAFRRDGTAAWDFGREGDGPREFRRISDVELRGDSIALFDPRTRRVSVLSPAGEWVRAIPLAASLLLGSDLVPISSDRFGVVSTAPMIFDTEAPSGLVRIPQTLLGVSWEDGSEIEVLPLQGEETVREVQGRGVTNFRPLFGRLSLVFPLPGSIGVAEGSFLGFEVFSPAGTLERRVAASVDLTLDESLVDMEWEARERTLGPEPTQGLRDRSPVPSEAPAADAAVSSDSGEVWLRRALGEYRRFVGPGPHTWTVFDTDGTWVGEVSTPLSFTVTAVSDEYVLGVRRDDLDVEHPELRRRVR